MNGLGDGVVVVGASLAGLHCADQLRECGYSGRLTVIGDEPRQPYDRTPLSKAVLLGRTGAEQTPLALRKAAEADWLLGTPAVRLDRERHEVVLADGRAVPYGVVVAATGVRARSWPDSGEAQLAAVYSVRTSADGAALAESLRSGPERIVVVGGGFIACEVASACSELGIPCTLVVRGVTLLASALGAVVGGAVERMAREGGVDVRLDTAVDELLDVDGTVRAVGLSTGEEVAADAVVLATGSVGNVEWLHGAGLDLTGGRVRCDSRLRAVRPDGAVDPEVFAIGDVSRCPHRADSDRLVTVEHWGSAVSKGRYAARCVLAEGDLEPFEETPSFWSNVWGTSVKSVGEPSLAEQVQIIGGNLESGPFNALYGAGGRVVGAVAFDMPRELGFAQSLVEGRAAFPFHGPVTDIRAALDVVRPAGIRAAVTAPRPDDPSEAQPTPNSEGPA